MSNALKESAVEHLRRLVGCDTQNPPRNVEADGELFGYLQQQLEGFDCDLWDLGDGCVGLHAVRGEPDLLFNFHVDTVPAGDGWTDDPHELRIDDERAVGLGACDIKGASACMLAAVEQLDPQTDVALLFTSDEEAGSSRCVRHFLEQERDYRGVVVAEPTRAEAIAEHRGIMTATGTFKGVAGHASARRALDDNALHHLSRWADAALAYADDQQSETFGPLDGIRFNLGRIEGGVKPNVIAPEATVRFGFRPRPDQDPDAVFEHICSFAPDPERATWQRGFVAPPLPASAENTGADGPGRRLAADLGLPVAPPVDFWTEAALFSQAGYPTVVFGPGDIARAHTDDEWVALSQLEHVAKQYIAILDNDR